MMSEQRDYKKLLSEIIKRQIVILGPDITLAKARNIKGLRVENDGNVTKIEGNPQELIQKLVEQFVQLSGLIVKKSMEPILNEFPSAVNQELSIYKSKNIDSQD